MSNKLTVANEIAAELEHWLNEWYSQPETWANEVDRQIHEWYANAPNVFPKYPYFSPSSATACPRSLYYKAKRAKKDGFKKPPYQGRWQAIGTAIGSVIQRDILAMEKHLPGFPFSFERNDRGEPMFEDFAKANHLVEHDGEKFYLFGTCDGILRYVTEDGETIRIGLEAKSKQTTAAKTSLYSMREPEEKHIKQCHAYAEMYGVDMYIILYVNASKKAWVYPEGEFEKSPDMRAFGIEITDEDKTALLDRFAEIQQSVIVGKPLELALDGWTFNGFKTACALDLSEEEVAKLQRQADSARHSSLPPYKQRQIIEPVEDIVRIRKEHGINAGA
ncbi:hypothetical protein [Terribacillus saccharophilus]|uniref:hypothetical protein n=1 Tax=Terribacillus saccharophilus TaxID=361277 RepID=UPI003D292BB2